MRKMKNSGIEWVGDIPEYWKTMPNKRVMHKLKEICEKYNNEDILSLTMNGVVIRDLEAGGKIPTSFDGYQKLYPNNLLMCLFDYDVTPRCIGLIKNNGLTSPAYSQFVLDNGNIPSYYYYYYLMIDNTKELLHLAKNLRHSFTEEQLGDIYTPVPPINEQIKIASFLDEIVVEIDKSIIKTKETIEDYKKYKDIVINNAITKGINSNEKLKDSKIQWIGFFPEKWSIKRMQDIGNYKKGPFGSSLTISMFVPKSENSYKVYEQKNAIYDDESLGYYYIPENIFNQLKVFEVLPGNIIVSCAGTIGKCHIMTDKCERGIINQALMKVELNKEVSKEFFLYLFNNILGKMSEENSNGSAIKNIPPFDILKKFKIPYPPYNEQLEIVKYLDNKCMEIDELIREKENIIKQLEQYKKSVIYEYVTGKKEVN